MRWSLFETIVDELKENRCPAVTLASRGDPTLHKDLGKMLHYLCEAGIMDVKLNTNAMILSEDLCHDILSANVNEVVFSVDAATKDLYERIRVKGKFETVLSNIARFHELREKHYRQSPTVTRISGVKINSEQDLEKISSFWSERVDQLAFKDASPRWDSYNNDLTFNQNPCTVLWERMYVWFDGKVNPCDFDYKSRLTVGDATQNSLKEIWTNEKYTALRHDHLKKKRASHNPCDRCPFP